MKIETRDLIQPPALADAGAEAVPRRLVGYAAKFDFESDLIFDEEVCEVPFVEVIRAGAFGRTLREQPDIRALYNHDTSIVLGRTRAGTLALREDGVGLAFVLTLPETQAGRDVRESVGRGDVDGCSFGFAVVEASMERRAGLPPLRTLIDIDLYEISACAFPAYSDSSLALRARRDGRASRPRHALALARLRRLDA